MFSLLPWLSLAFADPCGMVPPIYVGPGPEPVGIVRTGLQNTYVFYREGMETIAIRPGFTGTVEQFGMLVPLPSVPSLHKIDERTFTQLEAAVDPPQVTVHIYEEQPITSMPSRDYGAAAEKSADDLGAGGDAMQLRRDQVVVVKEEAIGMYEVAVLAAGSSSALQRWMEDNAFRYPTGMDDVVEDFVAQRWMFVAIKSHVAPTETTQGKPGMRGVDAAMPAGSKFDGYVQGMAFRFKVSEPVIPMRLSVFNGDDTHNRVYVLTEGGVRINDIPSSLVRRQVFTEKLHRNLTGPLSVTFDGPKDRLDASGWQYIESQRSPDPYVAVARDLFASDLLAHARGALSLPFEEKENELMRISEALSLRGAAIDELHRQKLAEAREEALGPTLRSLNRMTLTVIDGEFPRDVMRDQVLTLSPFTMLAAKNQKTVWGFHLPGPQLWITY